MALEEIGNPSTLAGVPHAGLIRASRIIIPPLDTSVDRLAVGVSGAPLVGLQAAFADARSAYKHAVSPGVRTAPAGLGPRKSPGNRTRHDTAMRFASVGKRTKCA